MRVEPPDHIHTFKHDGNRQQVCACGVNAKDECTWGHRYVEGSFTVVGSTGIRRCKACFNRRAKERRDGWTPERLEKKNTALRDSSKRLRDSRRKAVFDHYGWSCACCSDTHPEFLCIDHVNGGGNKQRKAEFHGNGSHPMYRWLIDSGFPAEFQTLCHNCNYAKHVYGTCPHQSK